MEIGDSRRNRQERRKLVKEKMGNMKREKRKEEGLEAGNRLRIKEHKEWVMKRIMGVRSKNGSEKG